MLVQIENKMGLQVKEVTIGSDVMMHSDAGLLVVQTALTSLPVPVDSDDIRQSSSELMADLGR